MKHDTFVFRTSWFDAITDLESDIQLEIFRAIALYSTGGNVPKMSSFGRGIFKVIKADIDKSNANYEELLTKRSNAGKIGMEKRWGSEKKHNKNNKCYQVLSSVKNDNKYNKYNKHNNNTLTHNNNTTTRIEVDSDIIAVIDNNINNNKAIDDNTNSACACARKENKSTTVEREIESEEFTKFKEWLKDHASQVLRMQKPFTQKQYEEIKSKFSAKVVARVLTAMGNHKPLLQKNISAYQTFLNWAARELPDTEKSHVERVVEVRENVNGLIQQMIDGEKLYTSDGIAVPKLSKLNN